MAPRQVQLAVIRQQLADKEQQVADRQQQDSRADKQPAKQPAKQLANQPGKERQPSRFFDFDPFGTPSRQARAALLKPPAAKAAAAKPPVIAAAATAAAAKSLAAPAANAAAGKTATAAVDPTAPAAPAKPAPLDSHTLASLKTPIGALMVAKGEKPLKRPEVLKLLEPARLPPEEKKGKKGKGKRVRKSSKSASSQEDLTSSSLTPGQVTGSQGDSSSSFPDTFLAPAQVPRRRSQSCDSHGYRLPASYPAHTHTQTHVSRNIHSSTPTHPSRPTTPTLSPTLTNTQESFRMPFPLTPTSPIRPLSPMVQGGEEEGSEGDGTPPPFSPLSASIRSRPSRSPSPVGTPRSSPLSSPRTPTGHQEATFSSGNSESPSPSSPSPAVTRSAAKAAEGGNRRKGRTPCRGLFMPRDSGVGTAGKLMSPSRDGSSSSSSGCGELRLSEASQEAIADTPRDASLQSQD